MKRKAKQVREGAKALRDGALRSGEKKNPEKQESENIKNTEKAPVLKTPEIKNIPIELKSAEPVLMPEVIQEVPKKVPELKLEQQEIPKKNTELNLEKPSFAIKIPELNLEYPKAIRKIPALKREQSKPVEKNQVTKMPELSVEYKKPEIKIHETTSQIPEIVIETKSETKEPQKPENVVVIAKSQAKKMSIKDSKPRLVAESKGLQALNLGKSYGGKPAVRDVSITIHRGEAVGLLGPNGAGKTTSFYMIMGLIKPDYGTISLDGNDITNLPVYRRARLGVGYLPQEASIFRGLTVEDNILAVLELTEPAPEVRQTRLEELLAEFSISHLRRTPSIALSGGERRRVEIARALASNPAFILLDEPLAGIDPVAVNDIKELISHLKHRGIGVLITDHNVREALDLLDRAYIIHNGTVLMEGIPKEIVANKEVRRVYLGEKFVL